MAVSRSPEVLLIRGGNVLTSDGARIEPADLLIEGDRIAAVGRVPQPADAVLVDAAGRLVVAGLVNAHVHAHNNLSRGLVGEWTLEDFLSHAPAMQFGRTPEEQHVSALLGAVEMLKRGGTSAYDLFADLPVHTDEAVDAVCDAYQAVGMRVTLAPQMVDLPFLHTLPGLLDALSSDVREAVAGLRGPPAVELLRVAEGLIKRRHRSAGGRIEVALAPSIPVGCSDEFLAGCARLSREHGVGVHTHLDEVKTQAVTARRRWGVSATRHLARIGLLGPRLVAAHAIWITDEDMALLADAGATIAHNPASNLRIGSGIAPIREALDHGVNVALGTDGSAASDSLDMYSAMRFAATVNRVRFGYQQERWLGSREVFRMATAGGATALGGAPVGKLEPGAKADLALIRLDDIGLTPLNHALNALVFREAGSCVETVLVDGNVVVEKGQLLTVDEDALRRRAEAAAERIRHRNRELWALAERVAPHLHSCCGTLAAEDIGIDRFA
jgi:5-methylthioadenosine/S-adenosylhomocysteine deaminase